MYIKNFKEYLNENNSEDEKRLEILDKKLKTFNRDDLRKSWQGDDKTLFNEYTKLSKEKDELYNSIYGSFEEREAKAQQNRIEYLKNRYSKFDYNNSNILLRYISDEKLIHIYVFDIDDEPQELPIYSLHNIKTTTTESKDYIINIRNLDSFLLQNNFNMQFKKDSLDAFKDVYSLFKDEYREYKKTGTISNLRDKNNKLIKY